MGSLWSVYLVFSVCVQMPLEKRPQSFLPRCWFQTLMTSLGSVFSYNPENLILCKNIRANIHIMLLSACCASQNGPAPDAGKAAVRQTQKPQTGSLFSDDEDIQVKLSDPTGDR